MSSLTDACTAMSCAEWAADRAIAVHSCTEAEYDGVLAVRAVGLYGWMCTQYHAALDATIASFSPPGCLTPLSGDAGPVDLPPRGLVAAAGSGPGGGLVPAPRAAPPHARSFASVTD